MTAGYEDVPNGNGTGWENPFRPGGELSIEADEIINMIKGGFPITPTAADTHKTNGSTQNTANGHDIEKKTTVALQQQQNNAAHSTSPRDDIINREKAHGAKTASQSQVSNTIVPGPTSASHVIISEKKNKKSCCVVQ